MTLEEEEAMQRMVEICSNLSECVEELFICLGNVVNDVTAYYPSTYNFPPIVEARRLLKHYDMSDDGEDEEGDDQ